MCAHQMVTITHPKQKQPPANTTPTRCDSLLNKKGKCYINITATEGSQPRILQYVPVLANSGVADNGGLRYGSLECVGRAAHASGRLRAAAVDTCGARVGLDHSTAERVRSSARGGGEGPPSTRGSRNRGMYVGSGTEAEQ